MSTVQRLRRNRLDDGTEHDLAAVWVMPYLEGFKSPRWFSNEVKKVVPAAAPIYIYAARIPYE